MIHSKQVESKTYHIRKLFHHKKEISDNDLELPNSHIIFVMNDNKFIL